MLVPMLRLASSAVCAYHVPVSTDSTARQRSIAANYSLTCSINGSHSQYTLNALNYANVFIRRRSINLANQRYRVCNVISRRQTTNAID